MVENALRVQKKEKHKKNNRHRSSQHFRDNNQESRLAFAMTARL